jgi:hypothetical protein
VNNYEYRRAIFAMNKILVFDGGSFLLTQNQALASPIAVIYYEEYETLNEVKEKLNLLKNEIQCVVANNSLVENCVVFGETQYPSLFDYPDNEDILLFCVR